MTPDSRGRRRWATAVLVAVAAALAWTGTAVGAGAGELHAAPVVLVGPDVVTAELVADADGVDGRPLEVGATASPAAARQALDRGDAVAVVTVDLSGTADALVVADEVGPAARTALVELVSSLERTYGRTVAVTGGPDDEPAPYVVVAGLAVGLGFLLVVLVSVRRGCVAPTLRAGLRRVGAVAAVAVVVGAATPAVLGLLGLHAGPAVEVAAATGAAVLAAGLVTIASEAVAGLAGLYAAASVLLAVPLPLLVAGDRLLLPDPWRAVTDWTATGATTTALGGNAAVGDVVRVALVLVGTPVLAVVVLLAWRSAQPRDAGAAAPATGTLRRQLVTLAVGAVAAAVVVQAVWATQLSRPAPRPDPRLASTTTCAPAGDVSSVDDLNRVAALRGSPEMRGGDIGASASLQDGRGLWMFGDTIRGDAVADRTFVRNSMIVVEPDCLQVVVPASGGAIITSRRDGVGYWPMSLVVTGRTGYDLVTVTAQRVRGTGTDAGSDEAAFAFEILGPALATYVVPVGGVPQLLSVTDLGPDSTDTDRPVWGAATATDGDWLYLYGTARPARVEPGDGFTGFSVRVARVRPDEVADQSRWRYWDGSAWTGDAGAAAELIGHDDGVSQTFSVFERDGRWLAFSKRDEVLGEDLVFWTAPSPTGPFTPQPPVGDLPSDAATGTLRYMPLAHPDLLPEPGSVVVSYSQNRLDVDEVLADPLLYRPRFLRVPLPPR